MSPEQIDIMLDCHRILIRKEIATAIHRINRNPDAEVLQEAVNNTEWQKFSKWLKEIKDD